MGNLTTAKGASLAALAAIVVTATFGARASNSVIPSYAQLLGKQFHFTATEIGLLAVGFMFSSFVASAAINARLRGEARRRYFVASAAAYAVVYSLFYFANRYLIWPIIVLAGLAMGPIMPNIMTSAGSVEDVRARERLLALYTLTLSVSLLVAQTAAGIALKYVSVREGFLVMEPLAVLVAVSAPFLPFPKEAPAQGRSRARQPARGILANEGFLASVLNNLTYQVPFSYLTAFAAVYAVYSLGAKGWLAVLAYAPFYATSLASRLYMTVRPPRDLVASMTLAPLITVAGLALAWASRSLAAFYAAMAILGIPHGMTYTLSVLAISRTFRKEELNAANSYFFSTMMVLGSALPAALGAAADAIGYRAVFLAIIPVVVGVLAATLYFARRAVALRSPYIAAGAPSSQGA